MATTLQERVKTFRIPRQAPAAVRFGGCADALAPGDRAPPFQLPDCDGRLTSPWAVRLCGRPVALVFGDADDPRYADELRAYRDEHEPLTRHRVLVVAIAAAPPESDSALRALDSLGFPVLRDRGKRVQRGYGIGGALSGAITILLDANRRVLARLEDGANAPQALRAARILDDLAAAVPVQRLGAHPPVLVIPRALAMSDCERLIAHWHRPVRVWEPDLVNGCKAYQVETGDFKLRETHYGSVVQMVVRDAAIQSLLDATLMHRVIPEIEIAFQTTITHREAYRIACYDAADGGGLPQHRDNNSMPTRDRRFTVSVALNAGAYQGGQLRFREYGEQLYEVETGTAIVWSAALLHEVLPVTGGRRFMVGTHTSG